MPEPVPHAELLRALGRLVRGLSALFWGLPIALVVCFHAVNSDGLRAFNVAPPMAATALLGYGLWQIGAFQPQERIWRTALDRARLLALINFGLSPFLFWSRSMPENVFFGRVVLVLGFSALIFLASLNTVLRRLGAMLPDETLRLETRQFTLMNLNLLAAMVVAGVVVILLRQPDPRNLPLWLGQIAGTLSVVGYWAAVPLFLLPLSLTMAMIWKTKEVILDSIFAARG